MSFLTSRVLRSIHRSPTQIRSVGINTRSFHVSVRRPALSESDHSEHDPEDRKAAIDHHKDDQLNKQKEGKGHWKKELSSNSEAALKADREEIPNTEDHISNMQKQTSEDAENERK